MKRRLLLTAAASVPLGVAHAATTVRFGSVGGMTDAGLHLAEDKGWFAEAGLTVQMLRMPNAPALLTALATGQLDIAGISVTPGLFSSISQGVQIRVVGDKQSVRPGFSATRLVVRKDAPMGTEAEQVAALRGKPVAVTAKAASLAFVLNRYLGGFGMSLSDVRVVEMSYPSMVPALGSGAIEAACILEPFLSQSLHQGFARQLNDLAAASMGGAKDSSTAVPLVYSESFARDRKTAQAFMDAYLKGVRVYNDAFQKSIDKDRVIGVLASRAKMEPEIIRDSFPGGLDPDGKVNFRFLDECQGFFVQQKYLAESIDLKRLVDPSFAEDFVRRNGAYAG